jgi:hypothetical protein
MTRILQNKIVRRLAVWLLMPLALMTVAICGWVQWNFPTCTFRYRLAAEVMTPEGLKTGSSVIEVSYSHGTSGGGAIAVLNMTGEAVYVDLGRGQNLFVTLTNAESGRRAQGIGRNLQPLEGSLDAFALPLKAFDLTWVFGKEPELCEMVSRIPLGEPKPVPLENLPTLVSFADLDDPDSVVVVQPYKLEAVLGPGVALHKVTLTQTRDAPTTTGMMHFPWWDKKVEEQKKLRSLGQGETLINNILDSAFRRPGIWNNNK